MYLLSLAIVELEGEHRLIVIFRLPPVPGELGWMPMSKGMSRSVGGVAPAIIFPHLVIDCFIEMEIYVSKSRRRKRERERPRQFIVFFPPSLIFNVFSCKMKGIVFVLASAM